MRGYWIPGHEPSLVNASLWHTPQACTLIRTCPAPGSGISRSRIWKSPPGLGTCATFMVAVATLVIVTSPPGCFRLDTVRELGLQPADVISQVGFHIAPLVKSPLE